MQIARDSREGLVGALGRVLISSKPGRLLEVISALDDLKISVTAKADELAEATQVKKEIGIENLIET